MIPTNCWNSTTGKAPDSRQGTANPMPCLPHCELGILELPPWKTFGDVFGLRFICKVLYPFVLSHSPDARKSPRIVGFATQLQIIPNYQPEDGGYDKTSHVTVVMVYGLGFTIVGPPPPGVTYPPKNSHNYGKSFIFNRHIISNQPFSIAMSNSQRVNLIPSL